MPASTLPFQGERNLLEIAFSIHLVVQGKFSPLHDQVMSSFLHDMAILFLALRDWEETSPLTQAFDNAVFELLSVSFQEGLERLAIDLSGGDDRAYLRMDRSVRSTWLSKASMLVANTACDLEENPEVH